MRGLASYLLVGVWVVLALAFVAPASWLGMPVGARTMVESGTGLQSVDRTNKSDRLKVPLTVVGKTSAGPMTVGKQKTPVKPAKILDGCDPVFSPLSTSAQANLPGRCAA
jgi:hypothetical protein